MRYLIKPKPIRIAFLISLMMILIPLKGICEASQDRSVYKIGPGDIISLTVTAGGEKQAELDLVVSEQGEINIPFIGNMAAAGLTLKNLEKKIYIPLEKDYFVNPQVNIQIKEYHSLSFTISGAVSKPDEYELDFHPTIMDLIAQAGGVAKDRGNIAYVLRSGSGSKKGSKNDPINIDLSKLLDEGDMTQNIMLETGDTVYIPMEANLDQARTKVYLEGEIKNPGMIDYQPGLTAFSACIIAGGFDKYAAPNRARIIRTDGNKHKIIKINLDKIKDGDAPDFPLKPGDRIHIPETWL